MDAAPHRAAWLETLCRRAAAVPHALPTGARERGLGAWLDEAIAHCDDELRAARFARLVAVPGAPPAAYAHRVVPFADEALLVGIRFFAADPARPFVDLLAWGPRADALPDWAPLLAAVRAAFPRFAPDQLRLRWPGTARPPVDRGRRSTDQLLVAGPLAALRRGHRPWGWDAADVRRARDLSQLPTYRAAFARWQRDRPRLGARVGPAQERALADCLETGALVELWQGPRWCGWMGARRRRSRVHEGHQVVTLFLDGAMRGRRRAAVLQRHLIEQLRDHGRDCLHGTIDGHNRPSLRTALRCGRQICETWHLARLAPDPA